MSITFKRITKLGWDRFLRDRSSTGAALVVMTIVLFVASCLYVLQGLTSFVVAELENSVDVSAYFHQEATEEEIFSVRQQVSQLPQVKEVEFVSKEQAFETFIEDHRGDNELLEPLGAIGQNPFLASLNIKAQRSDDFGAIAAFLSDDVFGEVVEKVDFYDRVPVIEQVSALADAIGAGALVAIGVLSLIAVLVAFNTIRLTIYNSREEIEIMRLVGASNWFIRGPFLVQGILVGTIATVLSFIILVVVATILGSRTESFTGFNITSFVAGEFFVLLLLQLGVGIGLGLLSSTIAIRRYLTV
jgi:cell division transport system permease protein